MIEFTLILCICALAAGAINTTKGSVEDLIADLGRNIVGQGVYERNADDQLVINMSLPEIKQLEDVWGIKPAPTQVGSLGNIEYNATKIEKPTDDTTGRGGRFKPIAQFLATTGSTYDLTMYYDTSYDPDGGSSSWLDRFWLIERVSTVNTSPYKCDMNAMCVGSDQNTRFNTADYENNPIIPGTFFPYSKQEALGGKIIGKNGSDELHPYKGYCNGVASQCLPTYYADGTYEITLVVQDLDGNFSYPRKISFTIETKDDYYSFVDEIVESNTVYSGSEDKGDKYIALVDHQFGLIKDLYDVEHVVIQYNMLKYSQKATWKVETTSKICRYVTLHDGLTGEMIDKADEPSDCWTNVTTTEDVEGTGTAGWTKDGDEEDNLWQQQKMEKNKWKFYIYDKRSLYYKKLLGNITQMGSPKLDEVGNTDMADFNSMALTKSNPTLLNANTWVSEKEINYTLSDAVFKRWGGGTTFNGSAMRLIKPNNPPLDYAASANRATALGQTYLYDFKSKPTRLPNDHDPHNDGDYANDGNNKFNTSTGRNGSVKLIMGFNNTSATTESGNYSGVLRGVDMDEHPVSTKGSANIYVRNCIGVECSDNFKAINNTSDLPAEPTVRQIISNYNYHRNDVPKTVNNGTELGKITDANKANEVSIYSAPEGKSIESAYRDGEPDYDDGSLMYQVRQKARGTNNENGNGTAEENDYDPEFVSVRLSLSDFDGYNPGFDAYTNQPYDGSGRGCEECTEPNYNEDVRMQWTEVRCITIPQRMYGEVDVPSNDGTCSYGNSYSYKHGHLITGSSDLEGNNCQIMKHARTRQMNIVEHFAFDWAYEYSGQGTNQAPSKTYKIKRAHWHTMGRTMDTIESGKYTDPYVREPYENKMNPDGSYNRYNMANNPKNVFTVSDGIGLPVGDDNTGIRDGVSNPDHWKILMGTQTITIDSGPDGSSGHVLHTDRKSCSFSDCSCECGCASCSGERDGDHYFYGKVTITANWVGMQDFIHGSKRSSVYQFKDENTSYYTESYSGSDSIDWFGCDINVSCSSCPDCPPPPSDGE